MHKKYVFVLLVVPLIVAIFISGANAIPWYEQNPAIKPGIPDFDWPYPRDNVGCGHVAAANVLWYWATHGFSNLVDGKPEGNSFPKLMKDLKNKRYLGADQWVWNDEMYEGIKNWFRDKNVELSIHAEGLYGKVPTWDFYQQQLRKCEVPLVLIVNDKKVGHWLTGVGWKDNNKFMFHDPNEEGIGEEDYAWTKGDDGYMHITYRIKDKDYDMRVVTMIAVTAVPEPTTLFLIGSGLAGIFSLRLFKKA